MPRYDTEFEIRAFCDKHDFGEENTKTFLQILQAWPDLDSVCPKLEKHTNDILKMLCRVKHLPGLVVVVILFAADLVSTLDLF